MAIPMLKTRGDSVAVHIADRKPFKTHGAMSGAVVTIGTASLQGQLPCEFRKTWRQDWESADGEMFAVWSYSTPIAWWTPVGGWRIPAVKYSRTTSRHQSQLYLAAADIRTNVLSD